VATRGGNQFDVLLASRSSSSSVEGSLRIPQLAILPTKFRKLVWVKRNVFVIVQTGGDEEGTSDTPDIKKDDYGGVRFIINHILYKEQVKHLRSEGLWPAEDPEFAVDPGESTDDEAGIMTPRAIQNSVVADDGILYGYEENSDDEDDDGDVFVNTNRIGNLTVQDSSSDDSDGELEGS
jgi:probable RNA-binding protein EIF1AD